MERCCFCKTGYATNYETHQCERQGPSGAILPLPTVFREKEANVFHILGRHSRVSSRGHLHVYNAVITDDLGKISYKDEVVVSEDNNRLMIPWEADEVVDTRRLEPGEVEKLCAEHPDVAKLVKE